MELNSQRQHNVYQAVKNLMVAKGIKGMPQPGYLRLEQLTVSAQGTYTMQIQKNVGTMLATENRLDQNDAFVVTHSGIALKAENPAQPGTGVLQYYPNLIVFPAEANNVNTAHLEAFWNGFYYVKVDDTVYVESGWLHPSRVVRTTLQNAGIANIAVVNQDSESFGLDGMFEQEPIITFDGSKKTLLQVVIPSFSGQQVQYVTATNRIYLVLAFYGFLITGGSNIGNLSN